MLRHNTAVELGVTSNLNPLITLNSSVSQTLTSTQTSGSPLDALPKQFVMSMKTLFDILDDQQTGFVKLVDIEKGWQDDGCKGLPRGVIESLRKVTPASGLLSFDRFCAGLKLCLLRNQSETTTTTLSSSSYLSNQMKSPLKPPPAPLRPPSAPTLAVETVVGVSNVAWNKTSMAPAPQPPPPLATAPPATPVISSSTAAMRPRHLTQRAISMPQLSPDSELEQEFANLSLYNSPPPPPKPPRAAAVAAAAAAASSTANGGNSTTSTLDKKEIRHALQNWQMGILLNEMDSKDQQQQKSAYQMRSQFVDYRGSADGGSSSATDSITGGTTSTSMALHVKKNTSKRREPRRHTLQNGIDYNMLRRLKQYEEEHEVLLLGLDAVEKARDWYLKQVVNVQEKIKYLGRMGSHVEQWSEVQQERLNFQRARVLEVNRNLAALADSWERGGFPMHFNLAIRSTLGAHKANGVAPPLPSVDRLRQQNRKLSNDVNTKSERITLLEREKQALISKLYDMQQRIGLNTLSNGFVNVLSQSSPVCSSSSGGLGDADVVF